MTLQIPGKAYTAPADIAGAALRLIGALTPYEIEKLGTTDAARISGLSEGQWRRKRDQVLALIDEIETEVA